MEHQRPSRFLSAIFVGKNRDTALAGGYLDQNGREIRLWPNLHMHIRFGGIDGAVWANENFDDFLLVGINPKTEKFVKYTHLKAEELNAFCKKDGIFYRLG